MPVRLTCQDFAKTVDLRSAELPRDTVRPFAAHYRACARCRERHDFRELFLQKVMTAVQDFVPGGGAFLALADQKAVPARRRSTLPPKNLATKKARKS